NVELVRVSRLAGRQDRGYIASAASRRDVGERERNGLAALELANIAEIVDPNRLGAPLPASNRQRLGREPQIQRLSAIADPQVEPAELLGQRRIQAQRVAGAL